MIIPLKQALSKERMVGTLKLATLQSDFYIKLREFMKDLDDTDFKYAETLMLELFRMRRGKIVRLADSIDLNSETYSKLATEESVFYKDIQESRNKFEKRVRGEQHES